MDAVTRHGFTKLLFVLRCVERSGIERALSELLRYLRGSDVEVSFRIQEDNDANLPWLADIPRRVTTAADSFWLKSHRRRRKYFWYRLLDGIGGPILAHRRLKAVQHDGADVVVDYDLSLIKSIKKVPGRRIAVLHCNPEVNWGRRRGRLRHIGRALAGYDQVLLLCNEMRVQAERIWPELKSKFIIMPHGIDLSRIRTEALAPLELPPGVERGKYLIRVCRLSRGKGLVTLLRAFAEVRQRSTTDWPLLILGDGPERARLEKIAAELGISATTYFLGWHDNPHPYVANAGLFILSSTYEALSMALLEAMTLGCPIVSTACPMGPPDLLRGDKGGTLVPVGDVGAMATAIIRYIDDPKFRRVQSESAMQSAARYDGRVVAREFLAMIKSGS